jgi:hypothetical protein
MIMKKLSWLFIVLLTIFFASNFAVAQEKVGMDRMRFGFGVALGKEILPAEGYPICMLDFPSFYVPIIFTPNIRIEPSFGLVKYSASNTDWSDSYTLMDIGFGIFLLKWYGPVNLYFGGRVGMFKTSYKSEYTDWEGNEQTDEGKQTNMYFGPAIGGEYFFTSNLSLGGEIQFIYVKMGTWDYGDENGGEDDDYSESMMKTKTLFFIRWYL